MAKKACAGLVKAGADSMSLTTAGTITSWNRDSSATIETFTYIGNCQEQNAATAVSHSFSFESHHDPADPAHALVTAGAAVSLEIHPVGEGAGNEIYQIDGVVESVSESGEGAGIITKSFTVKANSFTVGTGV